MQKQMRRGVLNFSLITSMIFSTDGHGQKTLQNVCGDNDKVGKVSCDAVGQDSYWERIGAKLLRYACVCGSSFKCACYERVFPSLKALSSGLLLATIFTCCR